MAGTIVSFTTGWTLLTACGAVALVYYPVATALTGRVLSAVHLRSILKVHPAGGTIRPVRGRRAGTSAAVRHLASASSERMPATVSAAATLPLVASVAADEFPQPRTAAR